MMKYKIGFDLDIPDDIAITDESLLEEIKYFFRISGLYPPSPLDGEDLSEWISNIVIREGKKHEDETK